MKSPLEVRNDYLVCTCMVVMYSEIRQAIDEGCTSFDLLQERFGVGTGCSSCVPEVHLILKESKRPDRA